MARSRKVIRKKIIEADPLYGNRLVAKFTNKLMRDGKKSVAQSVVYKAFEIIKAKGHDPAKLFETVLATVSPRMEVRPRRIGGASYQVPTEVRGERRNSLAIRWILTAAKARSNKEYHTFAEKLAAEFLDIVEGKGEAIRKRNAMHKTAESNRAFAHFRW
ncbi:TPA: 30S ribosomal protein S7 [Patescibacteria group bacterium]|uniref:Small ribosomal subunit protein uS7 n=1 Tax=Candidatus Gottesmanbacteria bacterium GW2011_GWA1_43_11 TaxID=1618436 RepID=A0A0G1CFT5_9BACT|nr:MAG: 30S ribosomal protein S7 [Candidatus Gottesmanbacteria bacterium GW2011_GWA1_43_11]HCS78446.1 30S ribosomal protein S7 [Patescibacteria group bacterium]